jgi:hypothetical protein
VRISKQTNSDLQGLAERLAIMRASAKIDLYHREPIGEPTCEFPTRIYDQFRRLYISLMSLQDDYSKDKALDIIKHVADSSGDHIRAKILDFFCSHNPYGTALKTTEVADDLRLGYNTAKPQLYILWQLGYLDKETVDDTDRLGRPREAEAWRLKVAQKKLETAMAIEVRANE